MIPSQQLDQPATSYDPPQIVFKGKLKQFAGSPLGGGHDQPADVLGLPGQK